MELEKLGDEKIALFCIVSDVDPTFNFLSAMLYSQMLYTVTAISSWLMITE